MKSTPVYAASKWGLRGWSLSCYEVKFWVDSISVIWRDWSGLLLDSFFKQCNLTALKQSSLTALVWSFWS